MATVISISARNPGDRGRGTAMAARCTWTSWRICTVPASQLAGNPFNPVTCHAMRFALAIALLSVARLETPAALPDEPVHVWQRWEHTLISSRTYSNAYAEVAMRVTYAGPGQRRIHAYGFWDGGETLRIRCAFPVQGTWTWQTECSDSSNAGLHAQRGSVQVVPYTGTNVLYRSEEHTSELQSRQYLGC